MTSKISFADNISDLEAALKQQEEELARLEAQRQTFAIQTQETRKALARLRRVLSGELAESAPRRSKAGMTEPLEVNAESGRPSRGARREQIETLCQHLGRGSKSFQTKEVLAELEGIEGPLSTGIRSYVYAVMNSLDDEGTIVKVGRGRWQVA